MAEKKKAKPARKIEEIIDLVETKLTDKEKNNLIKYLKEQVMFMGNKLEQLDMNIQSTQNELQQMKKQYNEMELYYKTNLDYVDKQTKAFAAAISKATYGGLN